MNKRIAVWTASSLCMLWLNASPALAADPASLRAIGGNPAASADGSIPAWIGATGIEQGWSYGKNREAAWKYAGDKPLFTITEANAAKYAKDLTAGELQALKTLPGYSMVVYPTRRDCGVPGFEAANSLKNPGYAKLAADGWGLQQAYVPGIPFPKPANGAEVMWNAKMRYRGLAVDYPHINTMVSPAPGSKDWITAFSTQTLFYPWGVAGSHKLSDYPPVEYETYFAYTAPPSLEGQALVVKFFLDQPGSETYYYFPGQRRVRRMPSYAYDAPQIGFEGQYTTDEPMIFNGTIDRFNWKILGKREIYVPYNSFGAYSFDTPLDKVVGPHYLHAQYRRYELHKVWVVEATLKKGFRHIAPKRIFYVDTDSWILLAREDYDAQGKLFNYAESYPIPVYETGSCDATAFSQYNLSEGRYVFDMNPVGGGKDVHWLTKAGSSPRTVDSFYTANNLATMSAQ